MLARGLARHASHSRCNREVLKRIKNDGDIFFAESDLEWILDGDNVHVSMVGFDDGEETQRTLDGHPATSINPNLTFRADVTGARPLNANLGICFMGPSPKAVFDISEETAREMLVASGNANARPNSDVLRRVQSGVDLTSADRGMWTVDFAVRSIEEAAKYEAPFGYRKRTSILFALQNRRKAYAQRWAQYAEARLGCATHSLVSVALSPLQQWPSIACLFGAQRNIFCNQGSLIFARDDDYFFGALQSRAHGIGAEVGHTVGDAATLHADKLLRDLPVPFPRRLAAAEARARQTAAQSKEAARARSVLCRRTSRRRTTLWAKKLRRLMAVLPCSALRSPHLIIAPPSPPPQRSCTTCAKAGSIRPSGRKRARSNFPAQLRPVGALR